MAADPSPMTKRLLATFLWFYTGWYAGAFIASILGVSSVLGPILGVSAALLIGRDPLHRVWASARSGSVYSSGGSPGR